MSAVRQMVNVMTQALGFDAVRTSPEQARHAIPEEYDPDHERNKELFRAIVAIAVEQDDPATQISSR